MDYRATALEAIVEKTGLDEPHARDLEIGIFNWAIDFAEANRVIRSWRDDRFVAIYKNKARSVIANVDPDSYVGNDALLQRLVDGEFRPHDIPYMKCEDVFPERWKDILDMKVKQEYNLLHMKQVAKTTLYRCSKCKGNQTTYTEMQVRSADEPMTLFVRCISCSHTWRM
jgi:DNA-directed RNA polymerase subunit M/transcription elongation factor TFIIS